jgi:hypothetical protein
MGHGLKLPKYVHAFVDRHGKSRYYLRRPGFTKRLPLPGIPYSTEFMDAYSASMADATAPKLEIGASRTKPGTVNEVIARYLGSAVFISSLSPTTQASSPRSLSGSVSSTVTNDSGC